MYWISHFKAKNIYVPDRIYPIGKDMSSSIPLSFHVTDYINAHFEVFARPLPSILFYYNAFMSLLEMWPVVCARTVVVKQ